MILQKHKTLIVKKEKKLLYNYSPAIFMKLDSILYPKNFYKWSAIFNSPVKFFAQYTLSLADFLESYKKNLGILRSRCFIILDNNFVNNFLANPNDEISKEYQKDSRLLIILHCIAIDTTIYIIRTTKNIQVIKEKLVFLSLHVMLLEQVFNVNPSQKLFERDFILNVRYKFFSSLYFVSVREGFASYADAFIYIRNQFVYKKRFFGFDDLSINIINNNFERYQEEFMLNIENYSKIIV